MSGCFWGSFLKYSHGREEELPMVNLYFSWDFGYRMGVAHNLIDQGIVDFILTEHEPISGEKQPPENENIITTSIGMAIAVDYHTVCDVEELPPVDKDLYEAMLPYESTAISFGIRRTNYPVTLYEKERQNYYLHLRYWDYMLKKYKINAIYFENIPHTQHKYVIYGLAMVYGIPILMSAASAPMTSRTYGSDICLNGYHIKEYYDKLVAENKPVSECVLTGDVGKYFELHTRKYEDLTKEMNPGRDDLAKVKRQQIMEAYHGSYIGWGKNLRIPYEVMRDIVKSIAKTKSLDLFRERKEERAWFKKNFALAKFYNRNYAVQQSEYNRMAKKADYSNKYIYFPMHLTPEASTLPKAGVFTSQLNGIQLLAWCARKKGIYIYVKEHFVQPTRQDYFYNALKAIPSVRLIKTTEPSYEIMKNALAAATMTGSSLMEAVLMGKPVIAIGDGYGWKGMPGLLQLDGKEDGLKIMDKILEGYKPNLEDLHRYFYALQETMIPYVYAIGTDRKGGSIDRMDRIDKDEFEKTRKAFLPVMKHFCEQVREGKKPIEIQRKILEK